MKLIGKRSAASALRWVLGLLNVFVMLATIGIVVVAALSLLIPEFGAKVLDALNENRVQAGAITVTGHLTLLGAAISTGLTWWIINRLRRILLSVNQGDAFEPANVGRLQAVGFSLLGIQAGALLLATAAPLSIGESSIDYNLSLGSWLGILVVFILAEVFRQGSAMRDEQMTTV